MASEVEKREGGWWFHDPNNSDPHFRDVGPYETKKEAEVGRRGLADFWKQRKRELEGKK